MHYIQASHLNEWSYCEKQYHLHRVLGHQPNHSARRRMAAGTAAHARHHTTLRTAHQLRRAATALVLAVLALVALFFLTGAAAPTALPQLPALPQRRTLILAAGAAALLALAMRYLSGILQARTQLPSAAEILSSDAGRQSGRAIKDRARRLMGKPDYIVTVRQGLLRTRVVAAEVKPERTADTLYPGDRLQAIAYGALLRTAHPFRAADYAMVAYQHRGWTVPLDAEATRLLDHTLERIRDARSAGHVARSHSSPRRCASCGLRDHCNEALA